jgi:hypothetical protein
VLALRIPLIFQTAIMRKSRYNQGSLPMVQRLDPPQSSIEMGQDEAASGCRQTMPRKRMPDQVTSGEAASCRPFCVVRRIPLIKFLAIRMRVHHDEILI